jgi:hypothetical protein
MAGPYVLPPGQTQYHIPTHPVWQNTTVKVENDTFEDGAFSMTAGGSATEYNQAPARKISEFVRNFAGVELAVKNESKHDGPTLTFRTE